MKTLKEKKHYFIPFQGLADSSDDRICIFDYKELYKRGSQTRKNFDIFLFKSFLNIPSQKWMKNLDLDWLNQRAKCYIKHIVTRESLLEKDFPEMVKIFLKLKAYDNFHWGEYPLFDLNRDITCKSYRVMESDITFYKAPIFHPGELVILQSANNEVNGKTAVVTNVRTIVTQPVSFPHNYLFTLVNNCEVAYRVQWLNEDGTIDQLEKESPENFWVREKCLKSLTPRQLFPEPKSTVTDKLITDNRKS